MQPSQTDILVMGGGLAGLTLALQVRQSNPRASITVVEKNVFPLPDAAHKVGESSVELGAHYFGKVLGLEEYLEKEQLKKLGLRFYFRSNTSDAFADRIEIGAGEYWPKPSYQLDRGRFENHLAELCSERGIDLIAGARVTSIELGDEEHKISFTKDGVEHSVHSRWLVDASGRAGLLRRKMDLHIEASHKINSVWFRVDEKINMDSWGRREGFEIDEQKQISRWYSTNHLMGSGYWVWIIPLISGATSVGIVADERLVPLRDYNSKEKAIKWLLENEPECGEAVSKHSDKILDFLALKNFSHKAKQVYFENRVALTGEAGLFLDPFYSPGSDIIAISNGFITDLINKDFAGEPVKKHASVYNRLYISIVENAFCVYEDQYPLFGNPEVMAAKINWDFSVYWIFLSALYCHDVLCDTSTFIRIRASLEEINDVNRAAQQFFREWHTQSSGMSGPAYIDLTHNQELYELNRQLTLEKSSAQVVQDIKDGVRFLHNQLQQMQDQFTSSHCDTAISA